MPYRIFTDATADLSPELLMGLPPVEIIPMQIEIGGREYSYDSAGSITTQEFYRLQRNGCFANTSQINPPVYLAQFEPCLRHGGRVSAAAAVMGTALQIKPLIHVDPEGRLQVAGKPCESKKTLSTLVEKMEQGWAPELGKQVFVAHGDNPEAFQQLRERIAERFPEAEIFTAEICPVIGAHTGPGMLALLYWGKIVKRRESS